MEEKPSPVHKPLLVLILPLVFVVGAFPASTPVALGSSVVDDKAMPYDGARSGTFECSGGSIPQNAEYVFHNVPLVKMRLDYDKSIWDARLTPGDGQTQKLILRNKGNGPQKGCVVHWSVIP